MTVRQVLMRYGDLAHRFGNVARHDFIVLVIIFWFCFGRCCVPTLHRTEKTRDYHFVIYTSSVMVYSIPWSKRGGRGWHSLSNGLQLRRLIFGSLWDCLLVYSTSFRYHLAEVGSTNFYYSPRNANHLNVLASPLIFYVCRSAKR
jgi:hypothetical protein